MRVIKENTVQAVLNFVKEYQKKEGRSPSFRQICHAMSFPSIGTAQKYVNVLKTRGLLSQNDQGKIEIPFNLRKGTTIVAPLVGSVACGTPILAEENIEENYLLPTSIFGSGETMVLHAKGDSMEGAGINNGDLLVVKICDSADDGDIVVALINDSATVKRLFKHKDYVALHPENPKYQDIITKEVKIQGIVKHVIHSF